ncbi:MAG TPA: polysaccharide biosynthesis/export family protein [Longimicrobiaceae bacterium]
MRSLTALLLVLIWTVAAAPLAAQFPGTATSSEDELVPAFSVGDAIRISVWGHPELSGEFEIGADSTIIHPVYQTIPVAGRSLETVTESVRTVLRRFLAEPEFVVEPLIRVSVGGAVTSPNIYTFTSYTTVAQAVTRAGPLRHAALERVRVLRAGGTMYVDVTRPYIEISHLRLRTGDQVIVDPKHNIWREYIRPAVQTAGSVASLAWLFLRITRVL